MADLFPFQEIEPKWHKRWDELFRCDTARTADKYYCLMMFPYPSGDLHVGHGRNYIIGDALARFKMMEGANVLAPMGWDAYGHSAADPLQPYEYLADHGRFYTPNLPPVNGVSQGVAPPQALPVLQASFETTAAGLWWSGSPYLGSAEPLPPGEGGFNPYNGFFFMWHSHAEREITNNDIFPGGMLTMMGVLPASAPIE